MFLLQGIWAFWTSSWECSIYLKLTNLITLFCNEFKHTAVSNSVSILYTETHGSLIFGNGVTVQLIKSRCWQEDFVALFDIFSESIRCRVNSKPLIKQMIYSREYCGVLFCLGRLCWPGPIPCPPKKLNMVLLLKECKNLLFLIRNLKKLWILYFDLLTNYDQALITCIN